MGITGVEDRRGEERRGESVDMVGGWVILLGIVLFYVG